MKTNAINRALKLRETLKKDDKILVVDFTETLQGKDTSRVIDLMPNIKTGEYVFRAKVNKKEVDPIASEEYNTKFIDTLTASDEEIEKAFRGSEFDFPLWYKHNPGMEMKNVHDYNLPFIMQVAGCNFHDGSNEGGCWYCFVDDRSNDGVVGSGKTYLKAEDAVESMVSAREKINDQYKKHGLDVNIKVFRTSGGEPTLVLDWVLDAWRNIGDRGLDFVGQIDSNLSTAAVVEKFEDEGIYEKNTLEKLAEYPIAVLTAIKGVNEKNLEENVQSTTTIDEQIRSIKKFMSAGFDIFPQMYNAEPAALEKYLKKVDSHIENFSARIHVGPLKVYGPTIARITAYAKRKGLDPEKMIAEKKEEWETNYRQSCEIIDVYLQRNHGFGYKEKTRSDVPIKVIK